MTTSPRSGKSRLIDAAEIAWRHAEAQVAGGHACPTPEVLRRQMRRVAE